MDYPDKIVVTGYSKGLGRALTETLPEDRLYGISRHPILDFKFPQVVFDLSSYEVIKDKVDYFTRSLRMDTVGVVLCAGTLGYKGGLLNSDLCDWENTFQTNVLGNLAVLQSLLPQMVKTGFGRVVFLSGGGAANAYPLFSGYALSKVAIVREVENIAVEMKDKIEDFSIIALAPGAMKTDMLKMVIEAGAEVRTTVDIAEPVGFIQRFLQMPKEKAVPLSGRFIHVRDDLDSPDFKNKWLLRRIE
jgi:NAD(P)-dependent dehydrogenase (short-subunit alcohol dehydrogenase family)